MYIRELKAAVAHCYYGLFRDNIIGIIKRKTHRKVDRITLIFFVA